MNAPRRSDSMWTIPLDACVCSGEFATGGEDRLARRAVAGRLRVRARTAVDRLGQADPARHHHTAAVHEHVEMDVVVPDHAAEQRRHAGQRHAAERERRQRPRRLRRRAASRRATDRRAGTGRRRPSAAGGESTSSGEKPPRPTVCTNGTCVPAQNQVWRPEKLTAPVLVSTECRPDETSVAVRPVVRFRSVIRVGPVSVKRPTVGAAASTGPTRSRRHLEREPAELRVDAVERRAGRERRSRSRARAPPQARPSRTSAICEMTVDR